MNLSRTQLENYCLTAWRQYGPSIIAAVLFLCAGFYFVGAQRFRNKLNANNPEAFHSEQIVTIKAAIDGDELLISGGHGVRTKLRLEGIKSFDPTQKDPMTSEFGRICFDHLESFTAGKSARLTVASKTVDDKGRLLGHVYLEDADGAYTASVAENLIRNGYTLVYTRYDFPDSDRFLALQRTAREAKLGIWSDPDLANRASALSALWEEEKRRDRE